ncbi:ribosome-recycling factor [Candidatus Gribaldobacteria bacterium]|nr:ribosome-recycling factor [Candidatus Gribaldobacteria bacterium]
MDYQEIINNLKPEVEGLLSTYKQELFKLRTGRLSPALIEDIQASCFGSILPLKQLGSISAPSLRELVLTTWDKSYVEGIVSAIEQSGLGLSLRVDGVNIHLTAPTLTEDSRKNLILVLNKKKEEFFQELRRLRDKAWKTIQDKTQTGELREDDKFKGRDKLDDLTRDYKEKMEEMAKNKEKEIAG